MHFAFQHADASETGSEGIGYEVVDDLDDADFAVVDADSKPAVRGIVLAGRVAQAIFIGTSAPPDAPVRLPRPVDPPRVLKAMTELASSYGEPTHEGPLTEGYADPDEIIIVEPPVLMDAVALPSRPSGQPRGDDGASHPEYVVDVDAPAPPSPESMGAAQDDAATIPQPPTETPAKRAQDKRDAKKTAARAAARRARLSQMHTDPGKLESMRDVLVLDADDNASAHITELLEMFGFRVHRARNIAQAADVLSRRPLAAAFLDIALNGADEGDGLALLQTIHDLPRLVGHPTPATLIVTEALRPADRVRAALAGIDAPLIKPVTRGDVARALEDCDVLLPSDARTSR